jgi:hypothetical protein
MQARAPNSNATQNCPIVMENKTAKLVRLWKKSPRLAVAYLRRKVKRQAKRILPIDDWNKNWLGEEMRPFNSLRS